MEVVKRNELHTFVVLPKRWVVERSFAWLEKCPALEELRTKAQYQPANGGSRLRNANPEEIVNRFLEWHYGTPEGHCHLTVTNPRRVASIEKQL